VKSNNGSRTLLEHNTGDLQVQNRETTNPTEPYNSKSADGSIVTAIPTYLWYRFTNACGKTIYIILITVGMKLKILETIVGKFKEVIHPFTNLLARILKRFV
jgi:hypothetical protein